MFKSIINQVGGTTCIYGASGSGKTRMLMQMEQQLQPHLRLRVSVETLHDDYISKLRACSSEPLHAYQGVKYLLLDNLWLLISRPIMASIVCGLIRQRTAAGRTTIVTSDLSLKQWQDVNPELAEVLNSFVPFWLQRKRSVVNT